MGGSSSSSTTTKTDQTNITDTKQADASGVISGNVLQGEITYTDQFGDNVAGAFADLVNLANKSIDAALEVGTSAFLQTDKTVDALGGAIEKVSIRSQAADQPEITAVKEFFPLIYAGIIATGIVLVATKSNIFKGFMK